MNLSQTREFSYFFSNPQATTPGLEKTTGGYLSFSGDIIDEVRFLSFSIKILPQCAINPFLTLSTLKEILEKKIGWQQTCYFATVSEAQTVTR